MYSQSRNRFLRLQRRTVNISPLSRINLKIAICLLKMKEKKYDAFNIRYKPSNVERNEGSTSAGYGRALSRDRRPSPPSPPASRHRHELHARARLRRPRRQPPRAAERHSAAPNCRSPPTVCEERAAVRDRRKRWRDARGEQRGEDADRALVRARLGRDRSARPRR